MSQKEYRKPYILTEGGYEEMMSTVSDKSVWNSILEIDPIWAEFLLTKADLPDALTAADIRYLKYLKQSEFKKMYDGNDYVEEEYIFNGVIPTVDPWTEPWDFPWTPIEGITPPPTRLSICDASASGCYCPGLNSEVTFTGTYPIVGISFVHGEGEGVVAYKGIKTNEITATINSPSTRSGQMRINVIMQLSSGQTCESTVNIYKCDQDECCPEECDLEWDWDASGETINAPGSTNVYVTGGTGPYSWSITSEDGKWSLDNPTATGAMNTVTAENGACGSATITVTDACGCTTEGSVRDPSSGSWASQGCGCPVPGASDSGWTNSIGNSALATRTVGKYRIHDGVIRSWRSGGAAGKASAGECSSEIEGEVADCCNWCSDGDGGAEPRCGDCRAGSDGCSKCIDPVGPFAGTQTPCSAGCTGTAVLYTISTSCEDWGWINECQSCAGGTCNDTWYGLWRCACHFGIYPTYDIWEC